MSLNLIDTILWGRGSTVPAVPDENIHGKLWAEPTALIFSDSRGKVVLGIPWEQIKECYSHSCIAEDAGSFVARALTGFLAFPMNWFVRVTWYDADEDSNISVSFFIGNTAAKGGCERRADKLARTILTLRSNFIKSIRNNTKIKMR